LRTIAPEDAGFLEDLFAELRGADFAATGWDEATLRLFLAGQCAVQTRSYQMAFPDAAFQIIEMAGARVGRMIIDRQSGAWRIIDLGLIAAARGKGLGRALLLAVQAEAQSAGEALQLSVDPQNPALRLYQRLGFVPTGTESGLRIDMVWQA
jgi:ribosomal protein S18 acetylase RimI-like enzyme